MGMGRWRVPNRKIISFVALDFIDNRYSLNRLDVDGFNPIAALATVRSRPVCYHLDTHAAQCDLSFRLCLRFV